MIAKVYSAIPQGYDGHIVEVEGDANRGLPAFNIVGMANKTISESRERVRAALANSGFSFPTRKVTISLAPAELAKDGSHLDLPIALAILVLSEQLLPQNITNMLFVGELALDGLIRPVRGIINIVEAAKQAGYTEIYLPKDNLPQAALIHGIKIFGVSNLLELFLHLKGQKILHPYTTKTVVRKTKIDTKQIYPILDDIKGQAFAKRALAITIAGHHNLLLTGPPGTGKSMLAQAALNLLPSPTPNEQIEITKLHSLSSGSFASDYATRPFRAPHHTASKTAIIGGGTHIQPGEISLAHRGILFLDELPEYPRDVLESLRQPLENGSITISRANGHTTYPANFILIATMNPCPCGHYGDPDHACICTLSQLQNYQKRLSGPIRDRIDLTVHVNRISAEDLLGSSVVENNPTDSKTVSEHNVVKNNITSATQRQNHRYNQSGQYNGSLSSSEIKRYIKLHPSAQEILSRATERFHLSARSYFKTIKVAQTIADLSGTTEVRIEHISEALSFRECQIEH